MLNQETAKRNQEKDFIERQLLVNRCELRRQQTVLDHLKRRSASEALLRKQETVIKKIQLEVDFQNNRLNNLNPSI